MDAEIVDLIVLIWTQLKGKRKEDTMSNKEREGSTQGEGGLYKKLQIPMLPQKSQKSGVTFDYNTK